MSRVLLFAVAAAAVILAQYVDRGSSYLVQQQEIARSQGDDNVTTGAIRRGQQR
jgi:hypothetical protein